MQNTQEQQCWHGGLEHQARGGVDEGLVDPAEALEQSAEEDHGKHRQAHFEGRMKDTEFDADNSHLPPHWLQQNVLWKA
ncbi:hypothetical protein [Halomonas cupida]|uniref:hypothetical protein n=1 Tax=Halomonas cupida TaxID=44933 RepID=UPI003A9360C2